MFQIIYPTMGCSDGVESWAGNAGLMVDTLHAYWLLLLVNMETKRKYVILTKNITPEHWNISKPIPVSCIYTFN